VKHRPGLKLLNQLIDLVERKGQEKAGGYSIGGSVRLLQRFLPGSDAAESLSGRFAQDRRDSPVRGCLNILCAINQPHAIRKISDWLGKSAKM